MVRKNLSEAISFKVTEEQRNFLEELARKRELALSEAGRLALTVAMENIEV